MHLTMKEPVITLYHPIGNDIRKPFEGEFDPYSLIADFFLSYQLSDVKHYLWEILKGCLGNENALGQGETANYIYFYERCHDLITACHLIAKENTGGGIHKTQPDTN